MPFSALSPEGPVSLLGADAATVESLRSRNRKEACFTAKCCGAALTIRTSPGKAPHFVHKVVPQDCDGDRRETWEHHRLKELIATSVAGTDEWEVETEAVHRDARTRLILWRADVLASRRRAHVAFEVQLSNADYEVMRSRQERYRQSGVRGLWFVRTRKAFPASQALPIFVVRREPAGDRVEFTTEADYPFIHAHSGEAHDMALAEFVRSALDGKLKWAPFERAPQTRLLAFVDYFSGEACASCGRTVARPFCVRARIADVDTYPEFQFARGVGEFRRTSGWYQPLLEAVWASAPGRDEITLRRADDTCSRCSAPLGRDAGAYGAKTALLGASLLLKDLPEPRFGTVERAWLQRWAVVDNGAAEKKRPGQ